MSTGVCFNGMRAAPLSFPSSSIALSCLLVYNVCGNNKQRKLLSTHGRRQRRWWKKKNWASEREVLFEQVFFLLPLWSENFQQPELIAWKNFKSPSKKREKQTFAFNPWPHGEQRTVKHFPNKTWMSLKFPSTQWRMTIFVCVCGLSWRKFFIYFQFSSCIILSHAMNKMYFTTNHTSNLLLLTTSIHLFISPTTIFSLSVFV